MPEGPIRFHPGTLVEFSESFARLVPDLAGHAEEIHRRLAAAQRTVDAAWAAEALRRLEQKRTGDRPGPEGPLVAGERRRIAQDLLAQGRRLLDPEAPPEERAHVARDLARLVPADEVPRAPVRVRPSIPPPAPPRPAGPGLRVRQEAPKTGPVRPPRVHAEVRGASYFATLDRHDTDFPTLAARLARKDEMLEALHRMRGEALDEFWTTLLAHGGDWDRMRGALLEAEPRRLDLMVRVRREVIDEVVREVAARDFTRIRSVRQSLKPTSDDDLTARDPTQANRLEERLLEELAAHGLEGRDPGFALDCNVYGPFQSRRFDPHRERADYVDDASRELRFGYVGLLRDGGYRAQDMVAADLRCIAEERLRLEREVAAGHTGEAEADVRWRGLDVRERAIRDAQRFHGDHLMWRTPDHLWQRRREERLRLAALQVRARGRDDERELWHDLNEQAGRVRAFESDSALTRGGFHSSVTVGQIEGGRYAFDPVDLETAHLEHLRGYLKHVDLDTPVARVKLGKYGSRFLSVEEWLGASAGEAEEGQDAEVRRLLGTPAREHGPEVREAARILVEGGEPSPEQWRSLDAHVARVHARVVVSDPIRAVAAAAARPAGPAEAEPSPRRRTGPKRRRS